MKHLITIHNLNNAKKLLKKADGLVVGLKGFSTRETSLLNIEELEEISLLTQDLNKELYISFKPFLFNENADSLLSLFSLIKDFYITGIIVGDIGYYYLLKDFNIDIIYNPEPLLTNVEDFNAFFEVGVKGAFVAKEININDVIEIGKHKKGKMFLNAHGYLNMFYSKRNLLKSYFKEVDIPYDYLNKTSLKIIEKSRLGSFPIIEDEFGTHIFRSDISSVINHLDDLKDVDYFLIDTLFKSDKYGIDILKLFKDGYDEKEVNLIKEKYNEKWDDGFLNLKTIYKRNEES